MTATAKAIPVPTELDRPYWEGASKHQFVLQRCVQCGLFSSQPRIICPKCHGSEFEWAKPSGRGVIHSYTIVNQTTSPGFNDELPYVVVHVQIEEEPTCYVTANLLVERSEYDKLDIDLPVIVDFEDRGEVTVPQFRLA
ncbi:MAG: OB-fold domain-containing protein [Actinobacteria bacterium]|nr:OB-fold domain-containing protein [Actinomycetota bacterium]